MSQYQKVKEANRAYYFRNKKKIAAKRYAWARARYKRILVAYGGKCACGSKTVKLERLRNAPPEVLALTKGTLHKWIVDNNFPPYFRLRCKECIEKQKTTNSEKGKRYRRKRTKAQIARDKKKNLEACARWRTTHTEQRATLKRNRRAAKLSTGVVTTEEWNYLKSAAKHKCLSCGKKKKLTMDHVVPLTDNGPHIVENIQPLCHSCNCRKNAAHTDYRTEEFNRKVLVIKQKLAAKKHKPK